MHYNCNVHVSNANGEFEISPYRAQWDMHWPNGVFVQLQEQIWLDPKPEETLHLYQSLTGNHPDFYVGFDRRYEFGQRVGADGSRRVVASLGNLTIETPFRGGGVSGYMNHPAILLEGHGDLTLTLVDRGGNTLQNMMVPQAVLAAVDDTFRTASAQVIENVADKAHRCKLEEDEIIVVT
jgi:hypothetical protein